jgi:molybdate transport system regulatory protein
MATSTSALRSPAVTLTGHLSLQTPLGGLLTDQRIRLLEAIDQVGSLNRAAKLVPLSYKAAWDALDGMNAQAPEPLVQRSVGGAGGGGTRLTDYARQLIGLYRAMQSSQQDVLNRLHEVPAQGDEPQLRSLIRRMTMSTSARNQFAGQVAALLDRGGLVDVVLDLGQGERLSATITPEAAADMGLKLSDELYALVKAPWVGVRLSAPRPQPGRNALAGNLSALRPGTRHTGCTVTLPSGRQVQAVVANVVAGSFQTGQPVWAVFPSDSVVLVSFS